MSMQLKLDYLCSRTPNCTFLYTGSTGNNKMVINNLHGLSNRKKCVMSQAINKFSLIAIKDVCVIPFKITYLKYSMQNESVFELSSPLLSISQCTRIFHSLIHSVIWTHGHITNNSNNKWMEISSKYAAFCEQCSMKITTYACTFLLVRYTFIVCYADIAICIDYTHTHTHIHALSLMDVCVMRADLCIYVLFRKWAIWIKVLSTDIALPCDSLKRSIQFSFNIHIYRYQGSITKKLKKDRRKERKFSLYCCVPLSFSLFEFHSVHALKYIFTKCRYSFACILNASVLCI